MHSAIQSAYNNEIGPDKLTEDMVNQAKKLNPELDSDGFESVIRSIFAKFSLSVQAFLLSNKGQNQFESMEFVFNERSVITSENVYMGYIVSYNLILEYSNGEKSEKISVNLTHGDVMAMDGLVKRAMSDRETIIENRKNDVLYRLAEEEV